jgi:hypothetical protein
MKLDLVWKVQTDFEKVIDRVKSTKETSIYAQHTSVLTLKNRVSKSISKFCHRFHLNWFRNMNLEEKSMDKAIALTVVNLLVIFH